MVYNESGNIIILFESGKFEFTGKNNSTEKMKELEDKLKNEIDLLANMTKDLNDKDISFGNEREKSKRIQKILGKMSLALSLTIPASMVVGIISLCFEKIIGVILSVVLTIWHIFANIKFYQKNEKVNKDILKSYEDDINKALNLLEKLDKMNLDSNKKEKIKSVMEKIKETMDAIDDYKQAIQNEDKYADDISTEYDLKQRLYRTSEEDVVCIGVVIKSHTDNDYSYIECVMHAYEGDDCFDPNNYIVATRSDTNKNKCEVEVIDAKKLSDDKYIKGTFTYNSNDNVYIILRCKKMNNALKKGTILLQFI